MKIIIFFLFFLSMGIIAKNEENIDDIIKKARVIELNSSSYESDCHKLTKIKLESNGIITLEISRLKPYSNFKCSVSKIYDVYAYPSDKGARILGAKGVQGKITDDTFYIQVSPKTSMLGIKYFSDRYN